MSGLDLALADAANNCVRESAHVMLTLRSGVQIVGTLDRKQIPEGVAQVKTPSGGWVAVIVSEIAAVESRR